MEDIQDKKLLQLVHEIIEQKLKEHAKSWFYDLSFVTYREGDRLIVDEEKLKIMKRRYLGQ